MHKNDRLRPWETALLAAVCVTLLTGVWAQGRQSALADKVVRLHVIAVSDDDAEQAVKLQVRDAVLAYLEPQLADVTDMDKARLRIADDLDGIARAAQTAARTRTLRCARGGDDFHGMTPNRVFFFKNRNGNSTIATNCGADGISIPRRVNSRKLRARCAKGFHR